MAGRRSGLGSLNVGTDATANVGCSTNTRDTHGVGSFPCDRAVQRDGELMRGIAHPCACSPRRVVVLGLVQPILHLCRRAGQEVKKLGGHPTKRLDQQDLHISPLGDGACVLAFCSGQVAGAAERVPSPFRRPPALLVPEAEPPCPVKFRLKVLTVPLDY